MHEHHVASNATDLTVSTVLHLLRCRSFYALLQSTEFQHTLSELVLSGRKQSMQPALKNVRPGWKKNTCWISAFFPSIESIASTLKE